MKANEPAFPSSLNEPGLTKKEYACIHITTAILTKYTLKEPKDQDTVARVAIELTETLFQLIEEYSLEKGDF